MDYKSKIINELSQELALRFTTKDIQIISMNLNKVLDNYDIVGEKVKYDLITIDDYNNDLIKRYIAKKSISGISTNSIQQYVRESNKLLVALNKRACDITSNDIENYLITYKYTHNISNTTLNNTKRYINNFFLYLHSEEIINRNPVEKVTRIKEDTMRDAPISKIEEEKLYNACTNLRDRALLEFLFATGCRVGEVAKAKINDVDFKNNTVVVIGKGNKQRTVCISDKALYHLSLYLNDRKDKNPSLFVGIHKARTIGICGIQSAVKAIGDRANVSNVHPHRFRATLATRLIDKGMGIHQVQNLLGHSSIDTTMIYYRGTYGTSNEYNKLINN